MRNRKYINYIIGLVIVLITCFQGCNQPSEKSITKAVVSIPPEMIDSSISIPDSLNEDMPIMSKDEEKHYYEEVEAIKLKSKKKINDNEFIDLPIKKNITTKLAVKKSSKKYKGDYEYNIGNLVYSIPDTMIVKTTYPIRFRIALDSLDMSIVKDLVKYQTAKIKTSTTMEVTVVDPTGSSFTIIKNNSDIQVVDSSSYTEWVYDVTPIKPGIQKLNIVVSIINNNGKKQVVYINSVYVKTNAKIIVKGFIEKYWQWCFTTLIIPFVVWLYGKRKKKEKNNESN